MSQKLIQQPEVTYKFHDNVFASTNEGFVVVSLAYFLYFRYVRRNDGAATTVLLQ